MDFNSTFIESNDSNSSEDRIQSDCFQWAWNQFPKTRGLLYHIRNGGSIASAREGNKFKAMGVVKGIPDLHLAIPATSEGIQYASLYIEMKKPKGKESEDQIRIHEKLREAGNMVVTCRNLKHFQEIFLYWLDHSTFNYK
jgi:hypothetical protein